MWKQCGPEEAKYKRLNMLLKIEYAPFEGGKLRHSTSNRLFIGKSKAINSKYPMGTPDNWGLAAAEGPKINIVYKRKLQKRPAGTSRVDINSESASVVTKVAGWIFSSLVGSLWRWRLRFTTFWNCKWRSHRHSIGGRWALLCFVLTHSTLWSTRSLPAF